MIGDSHEKMAVGNDGAITIKWTGTAGIEQAKNLQKNLLESFNGADKVLLDISELEDIDITGIQLVVSARKEAEKQKKSFYISGKIPEIILDFTAGCGVSLSEYALPENGEK